MTHRPSVTIAICTWNRASLLRKTLSTLVDMDHPKGLDWEVIVVNNNSTDDTDRVLAEFADRLPLKRIFEPEPGHANAKNAATKEARGEYVLWTDDDVLVERGWLREYAGAFEKWPDAAFFGGPIQPWFEEPMTWWLVDYLGAVENVYAVREFGHEEIRLSAPEELPYGANFAVRASDQREIMFDPRIGRRPGSLQSGEETTILRAFLDAGRHGRWVPSAPVKHWIPRERQTPGYIREYYRGQGEGWALKDLRRGGSKPMAPPPWVWRDAFQHELLYRIRRLTSTPDRWLFHLSQASKAQSRIEWYFRHRFRLGVPPGRLDPPDKT